MIHILWSTALLALSLMNLYIMVYTGSLLFAAIACAGFTLLYYDYLDSKFWRDYNYCWSSQWEDVPRHIVARFEEARGYKVEYARRLKTANKNQIDEDYIFFIGTFPNGKF